jgi:steroid delta-isomerase-like uncharacterized protein
MKLDYAKQWADALGNDTDRLGELYAPDGDFTIDVHMMDDHMQDTVSSHEHLKEKLGPLANPDPGNGLGVHTFEATEYLGDERWGLIHWDYTVEGADSYRGIPTQGKTLATKGSTFLRFNAEGKIILESTYFNDNPIFQELGYPVATPHYWEEGFDPAALAAG